MSSKYMFFENGSDFSNAEEKAYCREELIYNITEDLLVILEDSGVSKKELAERLGKSRSYVTQVLSGSRNMTLGSFSDICFALGFRPEIRLPVKDSREEKLDSVSFDKDVDWTNDVLGEQSGHKTVSSSMSNVIYRTEQASWAKVA